MVQININNIKKTFGYSSDKQIMRSNIFFKPLTNKKSIIFLKKTGNNAFLVCFIEIRFIYFWMLNNRHREVRQNYQV